MENQHLSRQTNSKTRIDRCDAIIIIVAKPQAELLRQVTDFLQGFTLHDNTEKSDHGTQFQCRAVQFSNNDIHLIQLPGIDQARRGTIRLKLLKISAQVRISVRTVWISFSESYPPLCQPVPADLHSSPAHTFTLLATRPPPPAVFAMV